jgi:hypothetical protein
LKSFSLKYTEQARKSQKAVGLYSNIKPYSDFIRHGVDGFLLPNDPHVWVSTIMTLYQNPELRKRIIQSAQERMQQHLESQ